MYCIKDSHFGFFRVAYDTIMDTNAYVFDIDHLEHLKGVMWAALFNEFRTETTDSLACNAIRRVDNILEERKIDRMILGD
jgi:hypothetical protein